MGIIIWAYMSHTIMHYFKVLLAVDVKLVSSIASTLEDVKKAVLCC